MQAVKASVIVVKTARDQSGPHINGYANYPIPRAIKLTEKSSVMYIELLVVVFVNFSIVFSLCDILYSVHWCW